MIAPPTGKFVDYIALLDTGADQCLFPLSFASLLGFDPLQMKMQLTAGVSNTANPTYYETVQITIAIANGPTLAFTTYAGFTQGMEGIGLGLLGQSGFFETYHVSFHHQTKLFHIEVP